MSFFVREIRRAPVKRIAYCPTRKLLQLECYDESYDKKCYQFTGVPEHLFRQWPHGEISTMFFRSQMLGQYGMVQIENESFADET